jgi:hypothetical protein
MIVREWRAQATAAGLSAYQRHADAEVVPALAAIDGFLGHVMTSRPSDGGFDLRVLTFWRDLDAVRAFAGPHIDSAVVEPEARAILSGFDTRVRHWHAWSWSGVASGAPKRA